VLRVPPKRLRELKDLCFEFKCELVSVVEHDNRQKLSIFDNVNKDTPEVALPIGINNITQVLAKLLLESRFVARIELRIGAFSTPPIL
jgi:hypothetical protein